MKTGLYLIPPAAPFVDLSAGAPHRTDKARCLTARYGQTTLSTHPRERSGVLYIKEATKKGWKAAYPGDTVDLGYAGSNTRRGRVGHDIAHTLETSSIQGIVERGGRIRRLMPRECFRLQGFEDEQIDKILAITSDAQAYKQAGNGVTVNVIEAIGHRIIGCMGEQYDSAELYDILHNALAMSDEDILSLGFDLPQCHEYDAEISRKRPKGRKFALYER